jgi:Zn finger protein HypA/HybF involved in hydrogenase expression
MTDDAISTSTCADCGQTFEDEASNLHEFCGECEDRHADE